jgi:hypothetical protein
MYDLITLALCAAAGTFNIDVIEPAPGFDDFAPSDQATGHWPLAEGRLALAGLDGIRAEFDSVFEER